MATNDDMRERLERVERKVDELLTKADWSALATQDDLLAFATKDDVSAVKVELADQIDRISERMYGVEERLDATNARIDVTRDDLRADITLAIERLDGLRELFERTRSEDRTERAADQRLLYALVKDHNRRLRALERLERRQRAQAASN